jgi:membrane-bound inhibitor of C-type lysozyme
MPEAALAAILGIGGNLGATSTQVILALTGDAQTQMVRYECGGVAEPFAVQYIDAAPNFLAVVPVGGAEVVFVNVTAASGARYVAGQYEWWTKGSDATFVDLQQPDAETVTCLEVTETP